MTDEISGTDQTDASAINQPKASNNPIKMNTSARFWWRDFVAHVDLGAESRSISASLIVDGC